MFDTCEFFPAIIFENCHEDAKPGTICSKMRKKRCDIKVLIVPNKSFIYLKMRQILFKRAKCDSLVSGSKIPHNCSSEVPISAYIKHSNREKLVK